MVDQAGDWRFAFQRNRGAAFAALLFAVIFAIYLSNHPAGFSWNVVQTAANKAALLAFVAAAQSLVVITGGIDLSAGMVLVLCNCLASTVVVGDTPQALGGVALVLVAGLAVRRLQWPSGRRRPSAADRRDDRQQRRLSSAWR